MTSLQTIKSRLSRFGRDTDGYITVEAIIVIPALLWIFAAGWVYFDAMHQQGVNQKANYALGDMVSRETDPLDADYITNAHNLLQVMTRDAGVDSDLRVSVVSYDSESAAWSVLWSEARGGKPQLETAALGDYTSRLPGAQDGDQLILVETWDLYDPVLEVGLGMFEITSYSFTRPRYAAQVLFDDGASS